MHSSTLSTGLTLTALPTLAARTTALSCACCMHLHTPCSLHTCCTHPHTSPHRFPTHWATFPHFALCPPGLPWPHQTIFPLSLAYTLVPGPLSYPLVYSPCNYTFRTQRNPVALSSHSSDLSELSIALPRSQHCRTCVWP
jgi:hypothetical protein